MTHDELIMQQALEALEYWQRLCLENGRASSELGRATAAIPALRDRLTQPTSDPRAMTEQAEPVACVTENSVADAARAFSRNTAPPTRTPLTDGQMRECAQAMDAEPLAEGWTELIKFARAIERAHGIVENK